MKDGRSMGNNNDEKMNSSLSSSVRERALENEGNVIQAARERNAQMPKQLSSNGGMNLSPKALSNGGSGKSLNSNGGLPSKAGLPNKEALSKLNKGNSSPNRPASNNNIASRGQDLKNKVASKGLQAMGVPKPISDGLVNSKLGKKAMGMAKNPAMAAINGLKSAGKSEAEKDAFEKEEEEQEKEKRSGNIVLRLPLKAKLIIFLAILPSFCFIVLFLSIVIAAVGDRGAFSIFVGLYLQLVIGMLLMN